MNKFPENANITVKGNSNNIHIADTEVNQIFNDVCRIIFEAGKNITITDKGIEF